MYLYCADVFTWPSFSYVLEPGIFLSGCHPLCLAGNCIPGSAVNFLLIERHSSTPREREAMAVMTGEKWGSSRMNQLCAMHFFHYYSGMCAVEESYLVSG